MNELGIQNQTNDSRVVEDGTSSGSLNMDLTTEVPSFESIPSEAPVEGAKKTVSFMILPWCC